LSITETFDRIIVCERPQVFGEQATKFEVALKTAKALGLMFPASPRLRANEVIQ
jgi:hypothetical protein